MKAVHSRPLLYLVLLLGLLALASSGYFETYGNLHVFTNETVAKSNLISIGAAIDEYVERNAGNYPDDLEALVTPDQKGHTYLYQQKLPLDPWGNDYWYEPPSAGKRFRVFTYGQDGRPGGEGSDRDLDNWSVREDEK